MCAGCPAAPGTKETLEPSGVNPTLTASCAKQSYKVPQAHFGTCVLFVTEVHTLPEIKFVKLLELWSSQHSARDIITHIEIKMFSAKLIRGATTGSFEFVV